MSVSRSLRSASLRSVRLRWGLIAALALVACGSATIQFTPAQDDAIMLELASVYTAGTDGPSLVLCEDRVRSRAWNDPGDCQEAHVVRGDGRGVEHKENEPSGIGCGGCPFDVLAYVRGTWTGAPFAEPVEVEGEVRLGDLYSVPEIFSHPYTFELRCVGQSPACAAISGQLDDAGQLVLTVYADYDNPNGAPVTFQTGDAAICQ
jgi:hypothetical protein